MMYDLGASLNTLDVGCHRIARKFPSNYEELPENIKKYLEYGHWQLMYATVNHKAKRKVRWGRGYAVAGLGPHAIPIVTLFLEIPGVIV